MAEYPKLVRDGIPALEELADLLEVIRALALIRGGQHVHTGHILIESKGLSLIKRRIYIND